MRFDFENYESHSPYYVEVVSCWPYCSPFMGEEKPECYIENVTYKTTIYVSGKRRVVRHHEPISIAGTKLIKDKDWKETSRNSNYSAQFRYKVKDDQGKITAMLYLDEVEVYEPEKSITDGDTRSQDLTYYTSSIYAGFLMQEVSVVEIKRLKQELKTLK